MDEFLVNLKLLTDTLIKKRELLSQILNITENQETILLCGQDDDGLDNLFLQMNEEKQKLINELLNADAFFQRVFESISPEFESNAHKHRIEVSKLQDLIREVTDYDVRIRVQEKKNKDSIIILGKRTKIAMPKAPKSYVIKQYEKNTSIQKKSRTKKDIL